MNPLALRNGYFHETDRQTKLHHLHRIEAPMIVRHTLLILAVAAVAGCGSVSKDSKIDYRTQAAPQRPLDVPPELSPLPPSDRYAVSQRPGATQAVASSGLAQTAPTVALEAPGARIERAGTQRWLVVDVAPEQTFETVRAFFEAAGLKVVLEEPALGILETDWAENRAKLPQDVIRRTLGRFMDQLYSTGELDKFRARIERISETQSEIFVTHRGMVEVYTSSAQENTRWQPRVSDPELEAEMLRRLLLRFLSATQETVTSEQMAAADAAQTTPVSKVASMVRRDAQTQLEIKEPFDRAWRRIGLALDRGGFTVEDRDRAQGIYFVRYIDPEYEASQREEQGFLSKVFGKELKIQAQQFRVWVQQGDASTYVSVQDKNGKTDRSETADKIVKQVYDQLR